MNLIDDSRIFHMAITGGGILTVKPAFKVGLTIMCAEMHWPEDGDTIKGEISTSLHSALDSLREKLEENFLKQEASKKEQRTA